MAELSFGEFVFDTRRLAVTGPAGEVPLRPRAREVLFYLIANRHRFVPRSELAQAVWHGQASPATINQTVSELRRALGDAPWAPAYIETRSKAGYRFVAQVVHQPTATLQAEPPSVTPGRSGVALVRRWLLAVVGALLALAVVVVFLAPGGSSALVVVPVVAEDGEPTTVSLADALARQLEVALAVAPFRVVPEGVGAAPRRALLLGLRCRTVHGLRVEVTARLTRVGNGTEVWRGSWVAPPDANSLPALAREVAAAVTSAAGERLPSSP